VKSDINREMQLDELKKLQSEVTDSARSLTDSVRSEFQAAKSTIEAPVQDVVGDLQSVTTLPSALPATPDVSGKPVL
jgi:sec-independent protein translocase protein TatB